MNMDEKIRITFLAASLQVGGRERQIQSLLAAISKNDNYFIELIILNSSFFYTNVNELPVKVTNLDVKAIKSFRTFGLLYKYLKTNRPHIIHACDEYVAFLALPIAKIIGVPFINASLRHGRVKLNLRHLLRKLFYHLSPFIIANSYAGLRANNLSSNANRIVIYNVVEESYFEAALPLEEVFIKEVQDIHSLSDSKMPVLLSVSRLHSVKDYDTVFKALSLLKRDTSFKYIIVGDGPSKSIIERQIAEYNLSDYVILAGQKTNVGCYYQISDVFIHSSKSEGCPNVVLEAMLYALPVIATDTGGTAEILKNGITGLLFPFKDSECLFKLLHSIINDVGFSKRISKEAKEYVKSNHNENVISAQYYSFVNQILNVKNDN
jgi:glycosyltransferase involved in cell wall biosynthesis